MASRLFDAAQSGDISKLQDCISNKGISVNSLNKTKATALHVACDWCHLDCARYLIQNGANVNAVDSFGRTPLVFALRVGFPELIELLQSNGAVSDISKARKQSARKVKVTLKSSDEQKLDYEPSTPLILTSRPSSVLSSPHTPIPIACFEDIFDIDLEEVKESETLQEEKQEPENVEEEQIIEKPIEPQPKDPVKETVPDAPKRPTKPAKASIKFADVVETIARDGAERDTATATNQKKSSKSPARHRSPGTTRNKSPSARTGKSPSRTVERPNRGFSTKVERNSLCQQDIRFFKSGVFSQKEQELLLRMEEAVIEMNTDSNKLYTINTRVLNNERSGKVAVCMHGFGWCQSGMVWSKMVEPLYNAGFSVVLVDLPGFGRSSGDNLQTRIWKNDGPEILSSIITALGITVPVSCIGYCGGGATFMRTFPKYSKLFSKRHVLHNCVIGEWPPELDAKLATTNTKMYVTWNLDIDHTSLCVSYKHLAKLRKERFPNVIFHDIDDDYKGSGCCNNLRGISRSSVVHYFEPSDEYIEFVINHFTK